MKKAEVDGHSYIIRFGGDDFSSALSVVKSLKDRSFIKDRRIWTAPVNRENYDILSGSGFDVPPFMEGGPKELPPIDESKLEGLFKFQVDGVRFIESNCGNGIIGDEMGIGKTIQAIGYMKLHPEIRSIAVICPASIKLNWQREIMKWTGEEALLLSGKSPHYLPSNFRWYIINYDILSRAERSDSGRITSLNGWIDSLIGLGIEAIIADEFQMVSNPKAIRTKAFILLKKSLRPKAFMGLSGTPIRNRPAEFFTMLNLMDPLTFPNRWKYLNRYCDPKYSGFGWTFLGATNTGELYEKIRPMMIRRLKKDVLTELPPKRKIVVPLELDKADEKLYRDADAEFLSWLREHISNGAESQEQVEKLKQLAYISKRNSVIQWIEDYLSSGSKLVVFTYHTKAIDDLIHYFKEIAVKIDGSVPIIDRQAAVDRFQKDDKVRLFVGQIQAAGIGITLTAASAVAFAEFGWTVGDHEQSEDRIHRIGQEADSVTAYYLIAEGTVEDDIMELLQTKYDNVSKVIDGIEDASFFGKENILGGLLRKYRSRL